MNKFHKGQKLIYKTNFPKKPCHVTFEEYNGGNTVTVRFNQLNGEKNVLATVDVSFLTVRPEKACRICQSTENRFYTENSRVCNKCEVKKVAVTRKAEANRLGFKNYYQLLRHRWFTSVMP